jgi:hypothetical protein
VTKLPKIRNRSRCPPDCRLRLGCVPLPRAAAFCFIKFRARGNNRKGKAGKAIDGIGQDDLMRKGIEGAINSFLDGLPRIGELLINTDLRRRLVDLADFTAAARSPVPRDRQGVLQYHPRPEVGTRLGKELGKLLIVLAAVRGKTQPDNEDFATVQRVADDCLPPNRLLAIDAFRSAVGRPLYATEIAEVTRLPKSTAARVVDDLVILEVVDEVSTLGTPASGSRYALRCPGEC